MPMNMEKVAYKKIVRGTNKALVTDLSKYLDKVKYKWFILYF